MQKALRVFAALWEDAKEGSPRQRDKTIGVAIWRALENDIRRNR